MGNCTAALAAFVCAASTSARNISIASARPIPSISRSLRTPTPLWQDTRPAPALAGIVERGAHVILLCK
jgi:hypothetical protein